MVWPGIWGQAAAGPRRPGAREGQGWRLGRGGAVGGAVWPLKLPGPLRRAPCATAARSGHGGGRGVCVCVCACARTCVHTHVGTRTSVSLACCTLRVSSPQRRGRKSPTGAETSRDVHGGKQPCSCVCSPQPGTRVRTRRTHPTTRSGQADRTGRRAGAAGNQGHGGLERRGTGRDGRSL